MTAAKPLTRPGPEPLDLPLKLGLARLANGISPASVAMAYADWLAHLAASPSKGAELGASAWRKSLSWMHYATHAWQGDCERCIEPLPQDKRFSPGEWHEIPFFAALAQAFLLQERWWTEAASGVRGVSQHHEDVVAFTLRQLADLVSPSNFVATNPQVLKAVVTSSGRNLVSGFANWSRDALAVLAGGPPRGVERFRPGEAVAVTPGQVVFRNHLIELIQYQPQTPQVDAEPVLIVPSWIMKYYILDLTPDDSLVRYLVQQGHTVFMVSWRNPAAEDRDLGMEDYLQQGPLAAVHAVARLCPAVRLHAAGYCLGGTLLAIAAAVLARDEPDLLQTVSILAGQVDFHEPGELGLFMDESQVAFLEDLMAERGYLDGRQMAGAFQLINSRDLVWSKLVHEYLMGAQTAVTALGAWNADATRLPARMHSEYLRRLYLHNDFAEGRYPAAGRWVAPSDLRLPLFVAGTERDHVSPWRSVYKIHALAHAPVSFLLASGGHNVGIVSAPSGPLAHPHASYRFASHPPGEAPADPQAWLAAAPAFAGSWWPRWHEWLAQHSSGPVAAREVAGLVEQGTALAAPGSYVHQR
ncbi:PHA/PHB synthase family protein [Ramlibacter sp.]|uniref:PHA/PHB synthase family protein n=1 Tax=Ramlibacter sp. TaxID=1917967 RepID=UPI002BA2AAB6|nr:alpha/beta fold hydrolase [Ramlibacter sp.]HWI81115.1 alpha/beta fold hydrolase [Ramlibacter sp.]